jgi:hypothetical protein
MQRSSWHLDAIHHWEGCAAQTSRTFGCRCWTLRVTGIASRSLWLSGCGGRCRLLRVHCIRTERNRCHDREPTHDLRTCGVAHLAHVGRARFALHAQRARERASRGRELHIEATGPSFGFRPVEIPAALPDGCDELRLARTGGGRLETQGHGLGAC